VKVAIIGAGPAGLYAAILMKRTRPDLDIQVVEQNRADATFGFGVVFSDEALAFLRGDDPETADLIEPHMKRWRNIDIVQKGERIAIDGVGFSGIGRLELQQLLLRRAENLGVEPAYETHVESPAALAPADLIVGADGLNSVVRGANPDAFGATMSERQNRFVWYGTDREFEALTQTFIETPYGPMNAHHYAYAPGRATFIIEMRPDTFARTGFADMDEPAYRAECEKLFAETLQGASLISNNSLWRRFPDVACTRWFNGNEVLVGDALHTAHYSIGSGTRLAMEDVIALVRALDENDWNVTAALPAYQAARQPVLETLVTAARQSCDWYEAFDRHMELDPWPFAQSYMQRAGRIDANRLKRIAPRFASEIEARGLFREPF